MICDKQIRIAPFWILSDYVCDVEKCPFTRLQILSCTVVPWLMDRHFFENITLAVTHVIEVIIKNKFLVSENLYNVIVLYK